MKVTSAVEIDDNVVQFSGCGKYIAYGCKRSLNVISVDSLEIVSTFPCTHDIKKIDWNWDSDHLLCVSSEEGVARAFSLTDPEWECAIKEGMSGMKTAVWSPVGYNILTLTEFHARISVWSLKGQSVTIIDNPVIKKAELSFSENGSSLAVITGSLDNYDISIFSTSTWRIIQKIDCTCDINVPSNPLWSPANRYITIWETVDCMKAFLEVYSVERSSLVGHFTRSKCYKLCMVSQVLWVPSNQFLLVGCCDENVYILNYITWSVVKELKHPQILRDKDYKIFEESKYLKLIEQRPVTLSKLKPVIKSAVLPGISKLICDNTGDYIATQCSSMPAVVWLWNTTSFSLTSIVIMYNTITSLNWGNYDLMISSEGNTVVLWSSDKTLLLDLSPFVYESFDVKRCWWCPKAGDKFLVVTTSFIYIAYDFNH